MSHRPVATPLSPAHNRGLPWRNDLPAQCLSRNLAHFRSLQDFGGLGTSSWSWWCCRGLRGWLGPAPCRPTSGRSGAARPAMESGARRALWRSSPPSACRSAGRRRSAPATTGPPWPTGACMSWTARPNPARWNRSTASTGEPARSSGATPTTAPTRSATRQVRGPRSRSTRVAPMPWARWAISTATTRATGASCGPSTSASITRAACPSGASPPPRWSMASW